MSYHPEPDSHVTNEPKLNELDLSNYATRSDLKEGVVKIH